VVADGGPSRRHRLTHNGFWLVVPVLVANMAFAGLLPDAYGSDEGVPGWLAAAEWTLRLVVFAAPLLVTVSVRGRAGRVGALLYGVGLALYVASWVVAVLAGDGGVDPAVVAVAPYWTPAVFLSGVAVMARAWWYLVPVGLFAAAHTVHGLLSLGLV
jgi:hypothetical protein